MDSSLAILGGEGDFLAVAHYGQVDGSALVIFQIHAEKGGGGDRFTVKGVKHVAGLEAGVVGGHVFFDHTHDQVDAGVDGDRAHFVDPGFHKDGVDEEGSFFVVSKDRYFGSGPSALVATGSGKNGVVELHPIAHSLAIDAEDLIARLEPGLMGGTGDDFALGGKDLRRNEVDLGGFDDIATDAPEDKRDKGGKEDVKDCPHDGDDHLVGVGYRGQAAALIVAFTAFEAAHIGELGEGDVAAKGEEGDAEIGSVFMPAEEPGAEADGEAVGHEAALFGRDEVAQLVDEDGEPEGKEADGDEPDVKEEIHGGERLRG